MNWWDFPGGPEIKNPSSDAGTQVFMPSWGTKISQATQRPGSGPQLEKPEGGNKAWAHRRERSLETQGRPDAAKEIS